MRFIKKMKDNNYAIIMAGGQGTRFWPWSTEDKPKQFLNVVGNSSLIDLTFKRIEKFIKRENIFIVADKKYLYLVKESIKDFKEENFIEEPEPKNTAPCLILSNIFISRLNSDANILVVPADHYILNEDMFSQQFSDALKRVSESDVIITSGIKPNIPHSGYGYIKFDKNKFAKLNKTEFYKVLEFKEKPDSKTAEKYIKSGAYLWNSGMFVYNLKAFKKLLYEYSEYYFNEYEKLEKSFDDFREVIKIYSKMKPESIDYALMEKVKEVELFEAKFRWSDVGSWTSVYELKEKDEFGNVKDDNSIVIDSENTLLFNTESKPIAIIGLNNVFIINTKNGILVSNKNSLQRVKEVIRKLKN